MPSPAAQLLRSRIGKVCVAIIGASPAEMIERASMAVKESPFLEFRLDYLEHPAEALPLCRAFLTAHTEATAIATCRRRERGGRFAGSVAAELAVLVEAASCGFHLVDLELESAEALQPAEIKSLRASGLGLIVSHHDFSQTGDLDGICRRIEPFEPEFIKIVPTAQSLGDNVKLMRFVERVSDRAEIVAVCMGDAGIISRVLGLRAGSAFTFAAGTAAEATAPGQIAARTLIETYRIEEIDAATKVYGVAGNPIGSSLSPVMMNTAFRRETVNAVYLALQTAEIEDLVQTIQEIPLQGVSITMPHKQAILPYLEHTDPLTAKIGACNTVLRQAGKLYGFNTDVQGVLIPLAKRMPIQGAKVLVLGAGGAARAAVFALRDKGADVFLLNRKPEAAAKLAKQSGAKVIKREALSKTTFDVILNATPVGMAGHSAEPLLRAEELKAKVVFDLVYNPVDTPLLKLARASGIAVITGVEMFVQQGARQFEIWTGKPAPEEEMLKVVIHALRQQAEAAASESPENSSEGGSMPESPRSFSAPTVPVVHQAADAERVELNEDAEPEQPAGRSAERGALPSEAAKAPSGSPPRSMPAHGKPTGDSAKGRDVRIKPAAATPAPAKTAPAKGAPGKASPAAVAASARIVLGKGKGKGLQSSGARPGQPGSKSFAPGKPAAAKAEPVTAKKRK